MYTGIECTVSLNAVGKGAIFKCAALQTSGYFKHVHGEGYFLACSLSHSFQIPTYG